ncbi:Putative diacyglycerol O-acyltransferase/MT3481 [Mycobacterium basiliense]|uniref:Diacylglycerol O-acyltransferase n=1 Tax=Mycobacterium basiliense TaxID=2094119 RepID=A0A447GAJ8_9MYCO|nr:wax ester/triacylglycerol synthase family O-acyltransferase [Mycobacterium basiliense]VDM87481.1 Putative diacyglycerol O-acyltransferase/MT3481 [Mycobacterium basiliense]
MPQLMTLDTGFLKAPVPEWHAGLAFGAVAVVNGTAPNSDQLKALLAERLQSIPRHAQVLRTDWRDHPEFDLAQHIQRVALPRPGDEAELFQAIANALERPLDLDRPLWECWIIEGLKSNRWAILLKLHHCMADGISAAHILTRLCDDADHTSFANHVAVKQVSASQPERPSWTDAMWQAPAALGAAAAVTTNVVKAAARAVTWPAAWPSSSGPRITMRRYTTVHVSIADVDRACRKFGVSANDVALAAISEGFRTVLLQRGEQPRADSLPTLEPADSRLSAALPYLPVEHDDPIGRLRTVHRQLNPAPPGHQSRSAGLSEYLPFTLCARALQALARLPQRGVVTLATDAPGPRHRLRLMGQRMDQVLPIPPTAPQLSTGVAVLSYGDELVFGITGAYDAAPEMVQLAAGIERGMARLVALSQDSVLLFRQDARKRSSRPVAGTGHRRRPSAFPVRARR